MQRRSGGIRIATQTLIFDRKVSYEVFAQNFNCPFACKFGSECLWQKAFGNTQFYIPEPSQNTSTQAEPVTLEQALLKERSKPYDQSDYKTFVGGEGIINEYAEFDCNLDHGYSKTINDLVVADGKLYQANFNSVLANGKNIQEVGTLPGKNIRY